MKTFPTLETLVIAATKAGHNENDAKSVIQKSYEYIKRVYPTASKNNIIEIAYVLY